MNIFKLSLLAVLTASLVLGGAGCKRTNKPLTQIPPNKTDGTIGKQTQLPPIGEGRPLNAGGGLTDGTIKGENVGGYKPPVDPNATGGGVLAPFNIADYDPDPIALKANTIYFDFDRAAVRASERVKVEEVATLLKGQPKNMVLIEGHCDERGTEEYNRALGERRALAIREYLVNLGIQAERVHTISYGEDKPADLGNNESAWAKNRRGEFILLKPRQ